MFLLIWCDVYKSRYNVPIVEKHIKISNHLIYNNNERHRVQKCVYKRFVSAPADNILCTVIKINIHKHGVWYPNYFISYYILSILYGFLWKCESYFHAWFEIISWMISYNIMCKNIFALYANTLRYVTLCGFHDLGWCHHWQSDIFGQHWHFSRSGLVSATDSTGKYS